MDTYRVATNFHFYMLQYHRNQLRERKIKLFFPFTPWLSFGLLCITIWKMFVMQTRYEMTWTQNVSLTISSTWLSCASRFFSRMRSIMLRWGENWKKRSYNHGITIRMLCNILVVCGMGFEWKCKIQELSGQSNMNGLVQDCGISRANVLEIPQSCTKPLIWMI